MGRLSVLRTTLALAWEAVRMMLEGLRSLARRPLRRMPVRFRVRAMEKKAMAAVIARRGCSMVWPIERKPWLRRVRKGMTLAEAKAGWADPETRLGLVSRLLGVRGRSLLPRTMAGLASLAAW